MAKREEDQAPPVGETQSQESSDITEIVDFENILQQILGEGSELSTDPDLFLSPETYPVRQDDVKTPVQDVPFSHSGSGFTELQLGAETTAAGAIQTNVVLPTSSDLDLLAPSSWQPEEIGRSEEVSLGDPDIMAEQPRTSNIHKSTSIVHQPPSSTSVQQTRVQRTLACIQQETVAMYPFVLDSSSTTHSTLQSVTSDCSQTLTKLEEIGLLPKGSSKDAPDSTVSGQRSRRTTASATLTRPPSGSEDDAFTVTPSSRVIAAGLNVAEQSVGGLQLRQITTTQGIKPRQQPAAVEQQQQSQEAPHHHVQLTSASHFSQSTTPQQKSSSIHHMRDVIIRYAMPSTAECLGSQPHGSTMTSLTSTPSPLTRDDLCSIQGQGRPPSGVREKLQERLRQRRASVAICERESEEREESTVPTAEEIAKREKRRAQNRKAAQRCREKKKQEADHVTMSFRREQFANTSLRYEIRKLQNEKKHLANVLQSHLKVCKKVDPKITSSGSPSDKPVAMETTSEESGNESDVSRDEK